MRLLIIGALDGQIGTASKLAMARGATVSLAEDIGQGLEFLRTQGADLVMIDARRDILSLIDSIEAEHINVPVVACGVASDATAAVRAIKAGALEYVPLPPDAEMIAAVLAAVADDAPSLVFRDPRMAQTMKLAEQVAKSQASVLITGESGTGKEMVARFIHNKSPRAKGRFVAVNCAAIPENLLESELFGHEKGAFTGAVSRRIGKFEEANGGTLLLDEISEMDIRLQAKLLRVLQEREIDRVGGSQPVKVDVRILATSNRTMAEEIRKGTFREDLYYRLNVVNVIIPSLRERPLDIGLLAEHFIQKYSEINGIERRPLSPEARDLLVRHSWRGNVRELENTLHRAVLLAEGKQIAPDAIFLSGESMPEPRRSQDQMIAQVTSVATAAALSGTMAGLVGRTVADVERDLIIDTLSHCLGNRTHAANILGISIRTLRNKLKLYSEEGLAVPPPAGDASATL